MTSPAERMPEANNPNPRPLIKRRNAAPVPERAKVVPFRTARQPQMKVAKSPQEIEDERNKEIKKEALETFMKEFLSARIISSNLPTFKVFEDVRNLSTRAGVLTKEEINTYMLEYALGEIKKKVILTNPRMAEQEINGWVNAGVITKDEGNMFIAKAIHHSNNRSNPRHRG